MENATQALLIAGGILFGIIILSAFVYMWNNASENQKLDQSDQEQARLTAWNAEWEAYDKRLIRGVEVLTVVNKSKQNDIDYDNSEEYKVTISIEGKDKYGTKITPDNISQYKNSIFECTEMQRNPETGRINKITFKIKEFLE